MAKLRLAALIVFVLSFTLFGLTLLRASADSTGGRNASAAPAGIATTSHATVLPSTPVQLRIPTIGVTAAIEEVGISSEGTIGTPYRFEDAAWYRYSAVPGMPGTAVIDGHVDNGLSLPGVFKQLYRVQSGDEIDVTRADGTVLRFAVKTVQQYPLSQVPSDALFSLSGSSRLTLITCSGNWDPAGKSYDQRLVVSAVLMGS